MTITAIYTSRDYDPAQVTGRYVRCDFEGKFWFCECVGYDRRYDVRQGQVDREDLPGWVIKAAEKRTGFYPSYVEWPL